MSINTKKIEKALAEKGYSVTVEWCMPSGGVGIDGYYAEDMPSKYRWFGYSLKEALVYASIVPKANDQPATP